MRRTILGPAAVFLFLLAGIVPAHAQIVLRFTPADTTIAPDGAGRLSIMLDDTLRLRTIDIRVAFDPAVVRTLGGTGGALFTDSGYQLFQGFEESAPGEWYGYTVIIGADDFIMGPGELFYWDFEAVGIGVSAITDVQTFMSVGDGTWYEDVSIAPTTVTVADPLSPVAEVPGLKQGLNIYPNPFNPGTRLRFELEKPGRVELAVFDVQGRKVTVLLDGQALAGPLECTWNGRDVQGRVQPGGIYLFRLATPTGQAVSKGVLLK